MKPILFLDFDGVLNSGDFSYASHLLWEQDNKYKSRDEFGDLFDERCVRWLRWIVLKTDCEIVVSSTWRCKGLNQMQLMWEMRDLPGKIIDITPTVVDQEIFNLYCESPNEGDRGYEIQAWIHENKPEKYCIVDDENDMLPSQMKYFERTNSRMGLNYESAHGIVAILNRI